MSILDIFRKKDTPETTATQDRKILVMSDLHCGHRCGLTPPKWWDNEVFKWGKLQRVLWNHYWTTLQEWKPFDTVLVNGDLIAGKMMKFGSTELITADRQEQADMAADCIEETGCKRVRMAYGTPFHTGSGEDHENTVRDKLLSRGVDAKIKGHYFGTINGKNINMKHKIEASTVPYGVDTPLLKHILWNRIWYATGVQDKADILIRSHVHYHERVKHDGCHGVITPSLQGLGDKYGSRQCVRRVDFGLLLCEISAGGEISWKESILEGTAQRDESEVLFA